MCLNHGLIDVEKQVVKRKQVVKNVLKWMQDDGYCDPVNFVERCGRDCPDVACQFFEFADNPRIFRLQIYNLFCLFWVLFFVSGQP